VACAAGAKPARRLASPRKRARQGLARPGRDGFASSLPRLATRIALVTSDVEPSIACPRSSKGFQLVGVATAGVMSGFTLTISDYVVDGLLDKGQAQQLAADRRALEPIDWGGGSSGSACSGGSAGGDSGGATTASDHGWSPSTQFVGQSGLPHGSQYMSGWCAKK
jgi:hypothetical protein